MIVEDFVMLGTTVPEPRSDGRVFVCSAGWSAELGQLIRIYPLARHGAPRRWCMVRAEIERPAPLPVGCSIADAARYLSVGQDKVRELLVDGRIRRLDLGDNDRPKSRVVIATISLFQLDPGFTPEALAQVLTLDVERAS